ncbi:MAG: hypothetical protein OXN15_09355 [Chloroflexota bacterium]|nr:hypothetical protein [Chloroflexota bacterium]MDE2901206.1 hypothetical protein [Chloroflexota bacterium]MDE2968767.1 hypothetical protein [Chloroflexota bacterium]
MQQTRESAFSRSHGSSTLFANRPPVERLVEEMEQEAAPVHEEPSIGADRRYRSQLQPPRPNTDWSDWAVKSYRVQERLASNLEQLIWGSIGALTGTALAALPVLFEATRTGYPFVLYQPLGAAIGATLAICTLAIAGKSRQRENTPSPSGWTTARPDRTR